MSAEFFETVLVYIIQSAAAPRVVYQSSILGPGKGCKARKGRGGGGGKRGAKSIHTQ